MATSSTPSCRVPSRRGSLADRREGEREATAGASGLTDQDDQLGDDVHGIDPTGDDIPVRRSLPSRRQRSGDSRQHRPHLRRRPRAGGAVIRQLWEPFFGASRRRLRPAIPSARRARRRPAPKLASNGDPTLHELHDQADELLGHVREIPEGFVRPAAEAGHLELPKAQGAELEGRIIGCNVVTLSV